MPWPVRSQRGAAAQVQLAVQRRRGQPARAPTAASASRPGWARSSSDQKVDARDGLARRRSRRGSGPRSACRPPRRTCANSPGFGFQVRLTTRPLPLRRLARAPTTGPGGVTLKYTPMPSVARRADETVVAVPVAARVGRGLGLTRAKRRSRAARLATGAFVGDDAPQHGDADVVDAELLHARQRAVARGVAAVEEQVVVHHDRQLAARPRARPARGTRAEDEREDERTELVRHGAPAGRWVS